MNLARIKETCLYVRDLDRTRAFYEGALNFAVISQVPGDHVFFRVGDSVLLCFLPEVSSQKKEPPPHYAEGRLHLAFEAEPGTYGSWKRAVQVKGIRIEQIQTWHNGRKESFYFRDPDEHLLEILEDGIWDPGGH